MNWVQYANQGAVRNQPLAPDLLSALSFLPEMGIEMKVYSGGQAPKGSGGARTGSTRHDHGNAADADFYYQGRKLDWNNPDDVPIFQEMVKRGKQNGVTGWGAGDDYMGAGRMHVGFGNPGVWGAGGKGANAPEWLRNAYHGAPGHVHKPGDENQKIADDTMATLGKAPVSQPSGGSSDRVLVGGLLGDTMGADMAEYEPEKAGGLLGKMFPNMSAQRRDEIKMGLAGMSLNPNQGLMRGIDSRMDGRREDEREFKTQQKAQAQANKTIAFIEAQVNAGKLPPELLQMAQADPASAYKAAVDVMTRQPKTATPYSDQAKIMSDLKNGLITREQANAALTGSGESLPSSVQELKWRAEQAGLVPGTPEYESFVLNGGGDPATFRALDMQAKASGYQPGTPQYEEFMATRGVGLQAAAKTTATNEANIATGGEAARVVEEGKMAPGTAKEFGERAAMVRSSITNMDDAISAIDRGANSGVVYKMLPALGEASASLRNSMNRLGLDVIGSVTFGALSAAELNLAMETAVPRNLEPAELRDWLERKRGAQVKAYQALTEAAQHFASGGTQADYYSSIGAQIGDQSAPPAANPEQFTSDTPPQGLSASDAELWPHATPEERQAIWGQ